MIFKDIKSIIYALIKKILEEIEATNILFFKNYERTKALLPDLNFNKNLWSSKGPFSILLTKNTALVKDSKRILNNELRVYKKCVRFNDKTFSWHKDFLSGKVYPKLPHNKIKIVSGQGHDIIVPWELSRLQFIPTLIRAHQLTNDSRYINCFQEVLDSWISENPYLVGVNWITGMDVSLRAINLALGLSYFHDYLTSKRDYYNQVLWAHAEYIYTHDIKQSNGPGNNHFLISIVGLLALSLCFRGKRADLFFQLSCEHLTREIILQFRTDGGNFESAVHYHQLALEAVFLGLCFLSAAELDGPPGRKHFHLPKSAEDRITKAYTFVSDYLKAFHCSPQFGDSSDGRVFIYKDYFDWDPKDHSFLLELGPVAIPKLKVFPDNIFNRVYETSGYGFFANNVYGICFNASPTGKSGENGRGHNHCDKGSFVLAVDGRPVLVDSGTYCYTPDIQARLSFKRTRAHNVVTINGLEQAEIDQNNVFGPLEKIGTQIYFRDNKACPAWTMEHNGYCRFKSLGKVSRTVRCYSGKLEVIEKVEGQGKHKIDIFWHLHPGISFEIKSKEIILSLQNRVLCILQIPDGFKVNTEKSSYSPAYMEKQTNDVVCFTIKAQLPLSVGYFISIENKGKQESPEKMT